MSCINSNGLSIQNIAAPLALRARQYPNKRAIVSPCRRNGSGRVKYTHLTYTQLEADSNRLANGLTEHGIDKGVRVLVMGRPNLDYVSLIFALFKIGAVPVMIDPGMGIVNMLKCIEETSPEGFIGVPKAFLLKCLKPKSFASVVLAIQSESRWPGLGITVDQLRTGQSDRFIPRDMDATELVGIFFTSGSTGIPKGVEYRHGQLAAQIRSLQSYYDIQEDEIDLPTFPLFILYCPAFGVTGVVAQMDFSRPAKVNPACIVEAIRDQGVTHTFGSPALWNVVSRYCIDQHIKLPSIKRILIAGAPVPGSVLERFPKILPNGEVFTPYGATEALPLTSIGSNEILAETLQAAANGRGTCVGKPLPGLTMKIIKTTDAAIPHWADARELPADKIGEIAVKGEVVTASYLNLEHHNRLAKISDGDGFWHRMGDVGYFDEGGRLWFAGRKKDRVETAGTTYYSVMVQGIFDAEPDIWRTALVGLTDDSANHLVLCVEFQQSMRPSKPVAVERRKSELKALANRFDLPIREFLFHPGRFPVDRRHNAKIEHQALAVWAARKLDFADKRSASLSLSKFGEKHQV